jgi:hypothetical protein
MALLTRLFDQKIDTANDISFRGGYFWPKNANRIHRQQPLCDGVLKVRPPDCTNMAVSRLHATETQSSTSPTDGREIRPNAMMEGGSTGQDFLRRNERTRVSPANVLHAVLQSLLFSFAQNHQTPPRGARPPPGVNCPPL